MIKDSQKNNVETNHIDLLEWGFFFWKEKAIIFVFTIIMIGYSIYYLKNADYKYSISLSVVPIQNLDASEISTSGLGFLARAAGMSSSSSENQTNNFTLYKAIIKSNIISDVLAQDQDFMIKIFEGEWNSENKDWYNPQISSKSKFINLIKNLLGLPIYLPTKPNAERLFKFLQDLNVSTDKNTNVTTITFLSSNPDLGSYVVEKVHMTADSLIKNKDLIRIKNNSSFLNKKLNDTMTHEYKVSLIQTLAVQQQKLMLATSELPYTAEAFSNINVSSRPVTPILRNVIAIYFIFGILLGFIFSIIKYYLFIYFYR